MQRVGPNAESDADTEAEAEAEDEARVDVDAFESGHGVEDDKDSVG